MKLNLGCRNRPIPGFKGMDIDAHEGVDFVGDVSDLSQFDSDSVEEIYASHILEHFPHPRTKAVLREWNRVLVPGGKLYVAVPDFGMVVNICYKNSMNDWVRNFLWGDQEYKTAFHYNGFDEASLTELLYKSGFKESERVESFGICPSRDCSELRIGATTLEGNKVMVPVSLNMIGTK